MSSISGFMLWGYASESADSLSGKQWHASYGPGTSESMGSMGHSARHHRQVSFTNSEEEPSNRRQYERSRPAPLNFSRQNSQALSASSPGSPLISSRIPPASPPIYQQQLDAPSPIHEAADNEADDSSVRVDQYAPRRSQRSRRSTTTSPESRNNTSRSNSQAPHESHEIHLADVSQATDNNSRHEAGSMHGGGESIESMHQPARLDPLRPLLLACGSNTHGQCGQDTDKTQDKKNDKAPTPPDIISMLMFQNGGEIIEEDDADCIVQLSKAPLPAGDHRIIQIAASGAHGAMLTDQGIIYLWGDNTRGQVARRVEAIAHSSVLLKSPSLRPGAGLVLNRQNKRGAPRAAAAVACGAEFCVALSVDGIIFAWGDNMYGQLGVQHSKGSWVRFVCEPTHIGPFKSDDGPSDHIRDDDEASHQQVATAVACGQDFTAVVMTEVYADGDREEGVLYTFGRNDRGQCGQGTLAITARPARALMPDGRKVVAVACGGVHCVALCAGGPVYAWGENTSGQLGIGIYCRWREEPQEVTVLEHAGIMQVSCGLFHTLAVSDGGLVYSWGDGARGQLGHGESVRCAMEPHVITALTHLCACTVSCGDFHSAANTVDGRLFTWGVKERGRLGYVTIPTAAGSNPSSAKVVDHGVQWLPVCVLGDDSDDTSSRSIRGACTLEEDSDSEFTWCCDVACGEENTIVLAHQGREKRRQLAIRAATLAGLCMGTRALRAMVNSYELPARHAAEWSRPVVSYSTMRDALSHSYAALSHVRTLLWDLAASWNTGGTEVEYGGVLLSHADGTRILLEYLLKLPVRMARVQAELKMLRFSRFVLEREKDVRAQCAWALLEHAWVRRGGGQAHATSADQNDAAHTRGSTNNNNYEDAGAAQTLIRRLTGGFDHQRHDDDAATGSPREESMQVSRSNVRRRHFGHGDDHELEEAADRDTNTGLAVAEHVGAISSSSGGAKDSKRAYSWENVSDLTRLMASCAALAPFLQTSIHTLLPEEDTALNLSPTYDDTHPRNADMSMRVVVDQGTASIPGLHKALATAIRDMNHSSIALRRKKDRWWNSGRVLATRNATYRIWIAFVCLLGLDGFGEWGSIALFFIFTWVLGAPFAIVFVAVNFRAHDPSDTMFRLGIGGALAGYIASTMVLVYVRVRAMHGNAVMRRRARRRKVRDTSSNRIAILALIVETWQLCAVSFGEGFPYDNTGFVYPFTTPYAPVKTYIGLNTIFPPSLLDTRLVLPYYNDMSFGICILIIVPVMWAFSRALPASLLKKSSTAYIALAHHFVPFIATILFMPVLARIAESISCAHAPQNGDYYLESSLHRLAPVAEEYVYTHNFTSCYDMFYTTPIQRPLVTPPTARVHMFMDRVTSFSVWGGNSTQFVSLCGGVLCWGTEIGDNGVIPHAYYALLGLLAFAVFFPSAALFLVCDTPI
jgi:alpha-tubulin suppressor-like RCC1 family protein